MDFHLTNYLYLIKGCSLGGETLEFHDDFVRRLFNIDVHRLRWESVQLKNIILLLLWQCKTKSKLMDYFGLQRRLLISLRPLQ